MKNPESILNESKNKLALSYLYRNISKELAQVEEMLQDFSRSQNPLITEIHSYIFKKSGKRVRPALLLLCSKLFKEEDEERILMASLIEALHTASLIHDDIIDNSELRRGETTVHVRWGTNITVLLGDYLYIRALGKSLNSRHPQISKILNNIAFEMVDGELFEYHMSWNPDIREEDYLTIINKKTAALFSASTQIGAILGGASDNDVRLMAEYGTCIGMCFQIVDDLLDYTGSEQDLGKPVLSDLVEGRITLPLISTLADPSSCGQEKIRNFMKNRDGNDQEKKSIIQLITANGSLEYTRLKAEEFASRAKGIIENFSDSPTREALYLLTDYILIRNK